MTITERAIGSHDLVVWATDASTGLQAAVAVHGATPTPALGPVVLAPYTDPTEAVLDALRRSEEATLRAAVLGVPLGGAAAVLMGSGGRPGARAQLRAFGRLLDRLDGRMWAMPGPGTTPADLALAAAHCAHIAGAAEADESLPPEARGAVAAARAAWSHRAEGASLAGARVLVLGAGRLGAGVARMLAAQDARVLVADPDRALAVALARDVDGETVEAETAIGTPCDVLMPCVPGLGLRAETVEALRCGVLAGPADGQLHDAAVGATLAARGIVWVPEALAGGGGLMAAAREMGRSGARGDVDADTARIAALTGEVLAECAAGGEDPGTVLLRHADRPLAPTPGSPRVRALRAA